MKFTLDIYFGMAAWVGVFAWMFYRSIKHPEVDEEDSDD